MALEKISKLDKIEIVGEFKMVQCRRATWVEDDGVVIGGKQFHRYVLSPGDDLSDQPDDVAAIANAVWADEVKAAYAAHVEAQSLV